MISVFFVSALIAATAQPYGPASVNDLTRAFEAICMAEENPLERIDATAAAMGFRPVEIIPSTFNRETKAWRLDGVRLFQTSGQKEGWPVLPMGGVSGDIGQIEADKKSSLESANRWGSLVMLVSQDPRVRCIIHSHKRGTIDVAIDKRDKSHVILSFLWQVGQPTPVSH